MFFLEDLRYFYGLGFSFAFYDCLKSMKWPLDV